MKRLAHRDERRRAGCSGLRDGVHLPTDSDRAGPAFYALIRGGGVGHDITAVVINAQPQGVGNGGPGADRMGENFKAAEAECGRE